MSTEDSQQYHPFVEATSTGVKFDRGLVIHKQAIKVHFEAPVQLNKGELHVYRGFHIGRYSYFRTGILKALKSVGRYCSIGPNVMIGEAEHPTTWLSSSPAFYAKDYFSWFPAEQESAARRTIVNDDPQARSVVRIGNDVWIGGGAMIRRGVTIGNGAVVAAGAFVNRDVEPYTIVGGLPARVLKHRFDAQTIESLQSLRWWEFAANDLSGISFRDPARAIGEISEREASGQIARTKRKYSTMEIRREGDWRLI